MTRILPPTPNARNLRFTASRSGAPPRPDADRRGKLSLKGLIKLAVVASLLFTGVQFSKVYVHRTQIKKIMGDEALDARRATNTSAETLKTQIRQRIEQDIPALVPFDGLEITGLGDPRADVVATARYTEVVDLLVYRHVMKMVVTAQADAPGR